MQNKGELTRWNDDRGFGFIKHSESEMVFLHISAVQLMPRRPKKGDIIFYDVVQDLSGKKKAACATIEGLQKNKSPEKNTKQSNFKSALVLIIMILAMPSYFLSTHHFGYGERGSSEYSETKKFDGSFTCQGKMHCSQMTSCEEAKFYLKNCPNQSTDGDGDGEPCESQWCN